MAAAASAGQPTRETAPQPRWRRGDRGQIAVVTLSHSVQHVYATAGALSIPFVVADFHVTYQLLGFLMAATGVTGGLMQGLAGLTTRVPRLSPRFLLSGQNAALGGVTVLAAAAPGFPVYAVARVGGTFATWPQHPVGNAYLAERFPRRRGLVLSWHNTGGNIGTLAVPALYGFLVERFGWRWSLLAFSVPIFLGAVLVRAWLPGAAAAPAKPAEAGAVTRSDRARPALFSLRTVSRPEVLLVLLAGTVAAAGRGLGVLTVYVPAYLHSGLDLPGLTVGFVFTALSVGAVFGPVIAGSLSDKLGRRRVLFSAYVFGAAAIVSFVLVGRGVAALLPMGLLVGLFAYAESPLLQSLFSDLTQSANATGSFGLYFAIAYGVGALWQIVLGTIVTHLGFRVAFDVMAASFVVAAALILAVRTGSGTSAAPQAEGVVPT